MMQIIRPALEKEKPKPPQKKEPVVIVGKEPTPKPV
jgi:hypothetical protein